jgi:6-phosphogluconolactonase (cycloisomerase 2 family)
MDPTSGALTAIPGSAITIDNPFQAVVDPQGKYLYAISGNDGLHGYQIASNGALQELAGSPFTTAMNGTIALAMDPSGKFVFLSRDVIGQLETWVIDRTSGTPHLGPTATADGMNPDTLLVDPRGDQLLVSNHNSGSVTAFNIINGSLNKNAPATTIDPADLPANIAFLPDAMHAFVAMAGTGRIAALVTNHQFAPMMSVAGSPFTGATNNLGLAIDAANDHMFVAESGSVFAAPLGNHVVTLSIDPSTNMLTPIAGATVSTPPHPVMMTLDPSGKFLLVAATGTFMPTMPGGLVEYAVDPSGTLTPLPGATVGDFPIWVTIVGSVE